MAMYKIAVIGDRDSVLAFKALGLDVFFTETGEEARAVMHRLMQEAYAVIYLTEDLAEPLHAEIARCKDIAVPAVILIPGKTGSLGVAEAALQSAVERAVGADIS
ncbi:MAG: V-type ATP synthase subunit F [Ruminococcaceae bacterium]|nr:V-type ATP synthase subunit F [Oscillospiraceae bacterium]